VRKNKEEDVQIWECLLATCAFKKPVSVKGHSYFVDYRSAQFTDNNPARLAFAEIQYEGLKNLAAFVNIGAGHTGVIPVAPSDLSSTLPAIVMDTERVADDMANLLGRDLYFRLNVQHGVNEIDASTPDIDIQEVVGIIKAHTTSYLQAFPVSQSIDECISKMFCGTITEGLFNDVKFRPSILISSHSGE
jgi:hypothetical protein